MYVNLALCVLAQSIFTRVVLCIRISFDGRLIKMRIGNQRFSAGLPHALIVAGFMSSTKTV